MKKVFLFLCILCSVSLSAQVVAPDTISTLSKKQTIKLNGFVIQFFGTTAMLVPVGTVAQRPGSPVNGLLRYNSDSAKLEFYNGNWTLVSTGPSGTPISADVQLFTSNGTWTKPAGAKTVFIRVIASGGGGGSGRKGATGSIRCGGGGGGGASLAEKTFNATDISATLTVTVGASVAGGVAQATNSTNGNPGTTGNDSKVVIPAGTVTILRAQGAAGGAGGTLTGGTGGNGNTGGQWIGAAGAPASTTGLLGATGNSNNYSCSGGGSGGGITAAEVQSAGGAGGGRPFSSDAIGGGTSGAIASNGGPGGNANPSGDLAPGAGGGGGGSSTSGAGGTGGAGGSYGAGGGGGGASTDAVGNSGAGGASGPGAVLIITYF